MSNLDFNVQLTMATAQFNQAVQTVMRNTAGMQTRLTQAVEAIQENSNKAGQAVKGLLSADDDKLVETLKNATTTINKLGAGARFNATELSSAPPWCKSPISHRWCKPTATGIENFLKQAGVDEQTAMQTARRLMNGVTNGDPYENIHKMAGSMGFKGSRYAGASTHLLHIAEQLRYRKADTQAIQAADAIEPQKTVNVNIKQGGQTINTSIPAGQENTMMEFLKQLENGKALSGR